MNILVTGGAGYIGSHVVKHLIKQGFDSITILDDLSTGFEKTVQTLQTLCFGVRFVRADLGDWAFIKKLMTESRFEAVIHFAAAIVVSESVEQPLKYYLNNTANTANLIKCACETGVKYFIFSSTAAVYGEPEKSVRNSIPETAMLSPINPYGRSKLFSEHVLKDAAAVNPGMKYVILRYFNVAGADSEKMIGQSTKNATHLIKIAAETALGKREKMYVFGDDYDTPDGTCIRDYVHVDDLAAAHLSALNYIREGESDVFNCGYGHGYSVKEVLDVMRGVCGRSFLAETAKRRPGDPDMLVSSNRKISEVMGWKPLYDNLEYICKTAYEWEAKLRHD